MHINIWVSTDGYEIKFDTFEKGWIKFQENLIRKLGTSWFLLHLCFLQQNETLY